MDATFTDTESATLSDSFGLDTWNRQRSTEELRSFVATRHLALPDDIELL